MDEYENLSHARWERKYHVLFIPKCRRKVLYGKLQQHLGEVFRRLAGQKQSRIQKGHLLADHVRMMIAISPKCAVSQVAGFMKGKSAIRWRGCTESANRTTLGRVCGRKATSSRR
jgi:putative transposase